MTVRLIHATKDASFKYSPDLSGRGLAAAAGELFRRGSIMDDRMRHYCVRLGELFRVYASCAPVPQWAPGMKMQGDVRSQHELYLPMEEVVPAFRHLCRRSCLYDPDTGSTLLLSAPSWPDFLARLKLSPFLFDPAEMLRRLAADESWRQEFLGALFVPGSFGGSFGRYPGQAAYLSSWLAGSRERLGGRVEILDAACGCGESTYEVLEILLREGYDLDSSRLDGSTLEPMELLAAAFGYYPADPARSAEFCSRVSPLVGMGRGGVIRFFREDIRLPSNKNGEYDLIICNGLLGGPLLSGKGGMAAAVASLHGRLRLGGLLLLADCFHQGWKKRQQGELFPLLREFFQDIAEAGEGVAAIKSGSANRPRRVRRQSP